MGLLESPYRMWERRQQDLHRLRREYMELLRQRMAARSRLHLLDEAIAALEVLVTPKR